MTTMLMRLSSSTTASSSQCQTTSHCGKGISVSTVSSSQQDPQSLLRLILTLPPVSKSIAFEMVTVDGLDNSWRHLVLPFAYQDDLVMSAVLAVSAFHLHLVNSPRLPLADSSAMSQMHREALETFPLDLHKLDHAVVSGLKQHLELSNSDPARNQSVLITILVLQVGAMVTGRSDFPSLYRMLNSAFEAVGGQAGLGGGDAADFIMSQVDK